MQHLSAQGIQHYAGGQQVQSLFSFIQTKWVLCQPLLLTFPVNIYVNALE